MPQKTGRTTLERESRAIQWHSNFTLRNDLRPTFDPGHLQARWWFCRLHFAAVTKSDYMR